MNLALALACLTVAAAAAASAAEPLKIGYCTQDLAKAKAAGFDYAEIRVGDFMKLSDDELEQLVAKNREIGLPTPAAYTFLPPELKIVGPEVDEPRVMAYATKAFTRCERLGVRILLFGSPAARKTPDGFSKPDAFRQLVAIGKKMAPVAAKHGLTLAAAPISPAQTNMINTTAEALAWVEAVGHAHFQFTTDLYHLVAAGDKPESLLSAGKRLVYAKISNPNGRVLPQRADEYDYASYFRVLHQLGYQGLLGVEASPDNLESGGPVATKLLRSLWTAP
jgi:sugar phosphate isomerase/epimerase